MLPHDDDWLSKAALYWVEDGEDDSPYWIWSAEHQKSDREKVRDNSSAPKSNITRPFSEPTSGHQSMSYLTFCALVVSLIGALRKELCKFVSATECLHVCREKVAMISLAVAVPEGILLPISVAALHCMNEPFWINNHCVCSVVLIPMDPGEGHERLAVMIREARPIFILVASVSDENRMQRIVDGCIEVMERDSVSSKTGLLLLNSVKLLNVHNFIPSAGVRFDEQLARVQWASQRTESSVPGDFAIKNICLRAANNENVANLSDEMSATNRLSHIVFTSGTTGAPKGCMSSSFSLNHYLFEKNRAHGVTQGSIVFLASAISFDPCFSDVLATILARAALALTTRKNMKERLAYCLRTMEVTHILCTPTLWNYMTATGERPNDVPCLKVVALGGEATSQAICNAWARPKTSEARSCRLLATYGVTEACVYQTAGEMYQTRESATRVGQCFRGLNVWICDESDTTRLRTVDKIGEIVLCGTQMDEYSSYLNDADLSSVKFGIMEGKYYYRTGDRGYVEANGTLHVLGRIKGDTTVKYRGVRIDYTEIETALVDIDPRCSVVVDCMVFTPQIKGVGSTSVDSLWSYVVLGRKCRQELGIAAALPSYGVLCSPSPLLTLLRERCSIGARATPSSFVLLECIPLSPTGKKDRKALTLSQSVTLDSLTARCSTNLRSYGRSGRAVAQQIIECLNLQQIQQSLLTTSASFAMLGGDSMAATRVVRGLYAAHHHVENTRQIGGEFGVLDGPFAISCLVTAENLGSYVDFLDAHGICAHSDHWNPAVEVERLTSSIPRSKSEQFRKIEGEQLYDALVQAATLSQEQIAIGLVQAGADPTHGDHGKRLGKTSGRLERKTAFHSSPLHLACLKGQASLTEVLLERGAKANSPDATGLFPIHLAASGDIGISNTRGSEEERLACVKSLLRARVPLKMKDGNKQTVLHCAARAGCAKILRYIMLQWHVEYGNDLRMRDSFDWRDHWSRTPVHWAILNGHVDALAVLLELGCSAAPPKPKASKQRTSLRLESPSEMRARLYPIETDMGQRMSNLLNQHLR